jgi:hypothetical protein
LAFRFSDSNEMRVDEIYPSKSESSLLRMESTVRQGRGSGETPHKGP